MICIGIEGTAHTLGIGIVNSNNKILTDERRIYSPNLGIHPREAAQFLADNFRNALDSALKKNFANPKNFQRKFLGPLSLKAQSGSKIFVPKKKNSQSEFLGPKNRKAIFGPNLLSANSGPISQPEKFALQIFGPIEPKGSIGKADSGQKLIVSDSGEKSNLEFNDIDLISFSQGPGLGPCLRTIATGARALSLHYKIPIIGVNHCIAHIEIGKIIGKFHDPLILYVSGGNTQILKLKDKRYRIFGETLDIGIGNMLDKFGRIVGLKHPAGPKIEEIAKKGRKYIELPYVVKGTDLSFSGILTSAEQKFKEGIPLEDLCFSLQETAFSMLTEATERALAHLKANELLLTGGVGNNQRLQEMLGLMTKEHNVKFGFPKNYCSDNGVMIAMLGLIMYNSGVRHSIDDTIVRQKFRSDDVEILW